MFSICEKKHLQNLHKPLKRQTKIAADDILIFYFYLLKKIRLDLSCESEDSLKTSSLIFSEKQWNKKCYSM